MTKSSNAWQNMPRKQQELVLGVWENVLSQVKFKAASPGDFGLQFGSGCFDGILAPKTTPFDVALEALVELAGTPKFTHPCPGCIFLGVYDWDIEKPYDLYFCSQEKSILKPHLTARWGDSPNDADRGEPLASVSADFIPEYTKHRDALVIAKNRATKRGLIDESSNS